MKKRLPRKMKKAAKKQGGIWQYALCQYHYYNNIPGSTSITMPNGQEIYIWYHIRQRKRHSGRVNTRYI